MQPLLATLLFFLIACSGDSSVPEGILPPEKMEDVLYDVVRADELTDLYTINDTLYRVPARRRALYDTIFRLQGLTHETFKKSLQYYQGQPALLKDVLDSMQKRIERDTLKIKADTLPKKR